MHSKLAIGRLWSVFFEMLTSHIFSIKFLRCSVKAAYWAVCCAKQRKIETSFFFSFPTCGHQCRAKVRNTEKELRTIIFHNMYNFKDSSMLVSLDRFLFPPPLFFCSTSVKSCPWLLSAAFGCEEPVKCAPPLSGWDKNVRGCEQVSEGETRKGMEQEKGGGCLFPIQQTSP